MAIRRDAEQNVATTIADAPEREAVRVSQALRAFGYSEDAITLWWNHVGHPELEGRTALQAWRAREYDAVINVVASKAAEAKQRDEQMRALIASGEIHERIEQQRPAREIVDDWRATHRT